MKTKIIFLFVGLLGLVLSDIAYASSCTLKVTRGQCSSSARFSLVGGNGSILPIVADKVETIQNCGASPASGYIEASVGSIKKQSGSTTLYPNYDYRFECAKEESGCRCHKTQGR